MYNPLIVILYSFYQFILHVLCFVFYIFCILCISLLFHLVKVCDCQSVILNKKLLTFLLTYIRASQMREMYIM